MPVFASSEFTAANGTSVQTVDNWEVHPLSAGSNMVIASNRAKVNSGSTECVYLFDVAAPSADHESSMDLYMSSGTGGEVRVCGRMDPATLTYYWAGYSNGTALRLFKRVDGANTQIGSNYAISGTAIGQTHNLKLRVEGNALKVFWDGVEVISQTDSSITAAGYVGFTDTSTGVHIDNFVGATLDSSAAGDLAASGGAVAGGSAAPGGTAAVAASGAATASGSASVDGGAPSNDIRLQIPLDLERGGSATNKTGLRYRIFGPDGALVQSGSALTTDSAGLAIIDIDASPYVVGDWVEVQLLDYDAGVAAGLRTVRTCAGWVQAVAQS